MQCSRWRNQGAEPCRASTHLRSVCAPQTQRVPLGKPSRRRTAMHSTSGRPAASSETATATTAVGKQPTAPRRSPQSVTLIRPAAWKGSGQPTFGVSVQPQSVDGRQRVATASADKTRGVCIWDLALITDEQEQGDGSSAGDDTHTQRVAVKLESEAGEAASGAPAAAAPASYPRPRGLLAVLPHHLSAVNVVRWEPVLGARLASGSDLPIQSIIIWKREAAGSKASDSTPFGLAHRSSSTAGATGASADAGASSGDSTAIPNLETWVAHRSLSGPTDITDLAWGPIGLHFRPADDPFGLGASPSSVGCDMDAPDVVRRRIAAGQGSQVLASCSLDRSVVVWNTDNGDRHHLKGHTGWVLGIAFDPQGRFLATQTIDGFVWLWSLTNFQLLHKVRDVGLSTRNGMGSGPRVDVGRTVTMARISFTPDGAALVACRGELKRGGSSSVHPPSSTSLLASASKSNTQGSLKHVSVVLDRTKNFKTQVVYGGHAGRTTVSAFNPVLFCADSSEAGAAPHFFSVLAVGSHDCSLSLWSTRRSTPLLVLTELWDESILDASWSGDGRTLLVSSHDGTVVVLQFDLAVFEGRPATQQEQEERLRSLYGDSRGGAPDSDGTAATSSAMAESTHDLYESPALLALRTQQKAAQMRLRQVAEQEQIKAQAEANKQAELARQQCVEATSAPTTGASSSDAAAAAAPAAPAALATPILSRQTEVRRAGGKRRIIPVSVPATGDSAASAGFIPGAPVRSTSTSANAQLAGASREMLLELTGAVGGNSDAADLFAPSPAAQPPKKRQRVDEDEAPAATTPSLSAADGVPAAHAASAAANSAVTPAAAASASSGSLLLAALGAPRAAPIDELVLRPPPRPDRCLLTLPALSTSASSASAFASPSPINQCEMQVTDYTGRPMRTAEMAASDRLASLGTLLSAFATAPSAAPTSAGSSVGAAAAAAVATAAVSSRRLVWQSFLPYRALLSVGNAQMLALACTDTVSGQYFLHFLSSSSGRQLHPPLLLPSPPFLLSTRSSGRLGSLLVVTCDGLVRVYDLTPGLQGKRLRIQASARPMLRATDSSGAKTSATGTASAPKKKNATVKEDVPTITAARLNHDDAPLLVLSNQSSYVYDSSFECWTLLSSPSQTCPGSELRSELTRFQRTAAQESKANDEVCTIGTTTDGSAKDPAASAFSAAAPVVPAPAPLSSLAGMDARTRVLHTVAQLESDLALRLHTGDAHAYRLALTTYVAKLVAFYPALPAARLKLAEVCRELSGPPSARATAVTTATAASTTSAAAAAVSAATASSSTGGSGAQYPPRWQPFVWVSLMRPHRAREGLSKRSLLSSLMPLLHTNAHLHAFTLELAAASDQQAERA